MVAAWLADFLLFFLVSFSFFPIEHFLSQRSLLRAEKCRSAGGEINFSAHGGEGGREGREGGRGVGGGIKKS